MEYYIVKSGMEMYDLSRAYGLGAIINILSNSKSVVKDFGHYYLIENKGKIEMKNIKKLSVLASEDLSWWGPLGTNRGSKPQKRKEMLSLLKNKKDISHILQKHSIFQSTPSKERPNETLYGPMESCAFKGERKRKRLEKYNEGEPFKISKHDFILSLIGHLNFTLWKFNKGITISVQLAPSVDGVWIGGSGDIKSIKNSIDKIIKRLHPNGVLPTLSNIAVNLAKEVYHIKYEEKLFVPKFSSLIFNVTSGGGPTSKPKPIKGGIYPLEFLYRLIDSTQKSGEMIDQWISNFRLANKPGYEYLALYLSEFIVYPSEETLDRYFRIHLRTFLSKDIKPSLYENDIVQELMENV